MKKLLTLLLLFGAFTPLEVGSPLAQPPQPETAPPASAPPVAVPDDLSQPNQTDAALPPDQAVPNTISGLPLEATQLGEEPPSVLPDPVSVSPSEPPPSLSDFPAIDDLIQEGFFEEDPFLPGPGTPPIPPLDFDDDFPSRFADPPTSLLGITPATRCLEIVYQPGDIVPIAVAPFADLRLQMPFAVQALKLGGGPFWEATYAEGTRHVWLKSASLLPEAAETSLTVLDESLDAFDFVVMRVNTPGYTCAIIELSQDLGFTARLEQLRTSQETPDFSASMASEVESLHAQLAQMRLEYAQNLAASQQAATSRIHEIHSEIYAGYAWAPEDDDDEISQRISDSILSVHDDGVRTFVRAEQIPSIGLIAIQGQYGGETQLVQTAYDPLLGMYTVTGIYDRLALSGGAEDARAIVTRLVP